MVVEQEVPNHAGAPLSASLLRFHRVVAWVGLTLAAALGMVSLFGWLINSHTLIAPFGGVPLRFNGAAMLALLSLAALSLLRWPDAVAVRRVCFAAGLLVAATSALTIAETAFGFRVEVDELFADRSLMSGAASEMPPIAAIGLLAAGGALLLSSRATLEGIADGLAALEGFAGLAIIGAYATGAPRMLVVGHTATPRISIAIGLVASALGLAFLRPETGLARRFSSTGPDGYMVRRLMPMGVLVVVVLASVHAALVDSGVLSEIHAIFLFGGAMIASAAVVVWRSAVALGEVEADRLKTSVRAAADSRALAELSRHARSDAPWEDFAREAAELLDRAIRANFTVVFATADGGPLHAVAARGVALDLASAGNVGARSLIGAASMSSEAVRADAGQSEGPKLTFEHLGAAHGVAIRFPASGELAGVACVETRSRAIANRDSAMLSAVGRVLGLASAYRRESRTRHRVEATLRAIADNTPAAIYVLDLDGRYLLANAAALRNLGLTEAELLGHTRDELPSYSLADRARYREHELSVLEAGTPAAFEESFETPAGMRHFVSARFPLLDESGEPYAVGGISTDVTELTRARAETERAYHDAVQRLARTVEFRDEDTGAHILRVGAYCELIAIELGIDPERAKTIRRAAALHDTGKVAIPDAILLKPGKLTAQERVIMERHTELGYLLLSGSGHELFDIAATIAWTHHEWFDGSGYPRHLGGRQIPLEGRIAAVADVFDALTSDRPYRAGLAVDEAIELMRAEGGTHFDPEVLRAFLGVSRKAADIRERFAEPGVRGREAPTPEP